MRESEYASHWTSNGLGLFSAAPLWAMWRGNEEDALREAFAAVFLGQEETVTVYTYETFEPKPAGRTAVALVQQDEVKEGEDGDLILRARVVRTYAGTGTSEHVVTAKEFLTGLRADHPAQARALLQRAVADLRGDDLRASLSEDGTKVAFIHSFLTRLQRDLLLACEMAEWTEWEFVEVEGLRDDAWVIPADLKTGGIDFPGGAHKSRPRDYTKRPSKAQHQARAAAFRQQARRR